MTDLQAARAKANAEIFGTPAWEAAMVVVRALVDAANAANAEIAAHRCNFAN